MLEEGLVEQPALERVGVEVGGLDVVGEGERGVKGLGDLVLVQLVAAEEVVVGTALLADPLLFLLVDVGADRVVVVGGEEFALFVVEPGDLGAGAAGFFGGSLRERVEVVGDGGADPVALFVGSWIVA